MRKHRSRAGFTLIELMIVIAIIAILAGIMLPNFIRGRAQSQLAGCKSHLKSIATMMEMYSADNGGRYPTSESSVVPAYVKAVPTCPSVGSVTYRFSTASNPDAFTVVCGGSNHQGAGVTTADYPQYCSVGGLVERP